MELDYKNSRILGLLGSAFKKAVTIFGLLLVSICVIFFHSGSLSAEPFEYEIKLATLAPENSSLMQVFNEMNLELQKETGGKVGFKMYAGFVLGDEEDVLRKLKIGLVHAAAFTSAALTDINPDLRALLVPFLFASYEEVDYVMEKLDAQLRDRFAERGYEVLGWPELGFLYFLSTFPIKSIEDVKGRKVWGKSSAPMLQAIMKKVGVSTVAVSAPDVLMALQTNLLEVVYNSPYYALVTQWYTQVKYVNDFPLSYVGGALIIDKKVMARLPQPLQETLRKVCAKHVHRLVAKTRKDNNEALEIIVKRGVIKVSPEPVQLEAFRNLSDQAMADLGPNTFPLTTYTAIRTQLTEFRKKHAQ